LISNEKCIFPVNPAILVSKKLLDHILSYRYIFEAHKYKLEYYQVKKKWEIWASVLVFGLRKAYGARELKHNKLSINK